MNEELRSDHESGWGFGSCKSDGFIYTNTTGVTQSQII